MFRACQTSHSNLWDRIRWTFRQYCLELYAIVCAVFAAQTDDLTFPTSWSQHVCNSQMGKFQGLLTFTHDLLICWAKGLSTWISKKLTVYLLKIKSISHYSLFPISDFLKTFCASYNVFTFPGTLDAQCCLKLSKVRTGSISAAPSPRACVFLGMYVRPEHIYTSGIDMWPDFIYFHLRKWLWFHYSIHSRPP